MREWEAATLYVCLMLVSGLGPCLCGDPECRRCFPATSPAPCPCCGLMVNCKCEWGEAPSFEGMDQGDTLCLTHGEIR